MKSPCSRVSAAMSECELSGIDWQRRVIGLLCVPTLSSPCDLVPSLAYLLWSRDGRRRRRHLAISWTADVTSSCCLLSPVSQFPWSVCWSHRRVLQNRANRSDVGSRVPAEACLRQRYASLPAGEYDGMTRAAAQAVRAVATMTATSSCCC